MAHMKKALFALALLAGSASAATDETAAPKPVNLTRLLGGAKIQMIDPDNGSVIPRAGISAAIDDDVSSGWTPPVGKTLLLISLPQEADLNSFSLFAPGAEGSFGVHMLSSPDEALQAAASGKPAFSGNFGDASAPAGSPATGRYMLIELDLTATAPLRSFDSIGVPKPGPGSVVSVVSPVSGEQNAGSSKDGEIMEVNFAAESLGGKIADDADPALKAVIDGDNATKGSVVIAANKPEQGLIQLAAAVEVKHVSLSFEEAKGKVTFVATDDEHPNGRVIGEAQLDGTSKTLTIDVPGITAQGVSILWEPTDGSPLVVGEIGVFALARVRREPLPGDNNIPSMRVQSAGEADPGSGAAKPPVNPPTPPPAPPPVILPPIKDVSP